jgi:hypothetical protein
MECWKEQKAAVSAKASVFAEVAPERTAGQGSQATSNRRPAYFAIIALIMSAAFWA